MSSQDINNSNERLTTEAYWAKIWEDCTLPAIAKPDPDVQRLLTQYLPKSTDMSLIEIGCSPGRWMAYYHKQFGYNVSGIEYVESAAELTRKNMAMQTIEARVIAGDFFKLEIAPGEYDVAYSGGFIEHFENLQGTIERIGRLTSNLIVTAVPNLYGLNGLMSKMIRPDVFKSHKRIELSLLQKIHESLGFQTLFCNYVGGLQWIMPASHTPFFKEHKTFSKVLNLPFWFFNRGSVQLSNLFRINPRTRCLSHSLMYIGQRT